MIETSPRELMLRGLWWHSAGELGYSPWACKWGGLKPDTPIVVSDIEAGALFPGSSFKRV